MGLAHRKQLAVILALALLSSCLAGCSGGEEEPSERSSLVVLAASSLTDVFGELEGTFEEQNPGTNVQVSFAGSPELLLQLQQGAPADVFAPADEAKMETAVEEGLVTEPQTFVRNRPVILVPAANPAGIQELRDLAEADAQLVLAEEGVPIAEYARQVLTNGDSAYGEGFSENVLNQLVSREPNVRAAAQRVSLGEADATFVYQSDVTEDIRDRVKVVEIPAELNVLATYPIAVVEGTNNPELAQEWVDLTLSEYGQSLLESYNFIPA